MGLFFSLSHFFLNKKNRVKVVKIRGFYDF